MSSILKKKMSLPENNEEMFWEAVLSRETRFDGEFVFAVSTTGIYCRPSCPARRPKRERVSFFRLPEAARKAGFRACLRCHPDHTRSSDPKLDLVQRACRMIEDQAGEKLSLELLGERLGVSSFQLQRTFKNIMLITPRQYAEACRVKQFRSGVSDGESITSAMYGAGYGSSSRLYERAKSELGMTPATYRRRGADTVIRYTIAESPLGSLLVAATDEGICSVRLGGSSAQLDEDLRKEFELAELNSDDSALRSAVEQIVAHLSGRQRSLDLPVDIRATAFQRQVWEALQRIPYGQTRSYSEVAKEIGNPTAVRAVARACATNPVALVIPCHRVIREDRTMGGYRWGVERKRKLLAQEKNAVSKSES